MAKTMLNKAQRDQVTDCLSAWSEWSGSNSRGFARAQLGTVGGGDGTDGARPLVGPVVDAVEDAMRKLHAADENLHALVKWLWLEYHQCEPLAVRAQRLKVSESSVQRWTDRAYAVIWNHLVTTDVVVGKKLAA
mgnify:CR=1 FL=1